LSFFDFNTIVFYCQYLTGNYFSVKLLLSLNKERKFKMTKLNQVIAVEKGVKSRDHSEVSALYKLAQKPELFNGANRVFRKKGKK